MTKTFVVTGTLTDTRTVRLSEPLPVPVGEVLVTIEVTAPSRPAPRFLAVLEEAWREQDANGYVPPSAAEVAERIRDARKGWSD